MQGVLTLPTGFKGRIGLLIPRRNATLEPEVYQMTPAGLSWHFARLDGTGDTETGLTQMRDDLQRAAASLQTLGLSLLAFACTAATFFRGRHNAVELGQELARLSDVPTLTAGAAVVNALKATEARRVVVLTPYREWLTERLTSYLHEYQLEVVSSASMGFSQHIDQIAGSSLTDRARHLVAHHRADALFISCTNLPTLHHIAPLEAELQLPVISSNQALIWAAMQRAGFQTGEFRRWGSLFERSPSDDGVV